MACSCNDTEEDKRSRGIEKQLLADREFSHAIKILVCGAGDSGKTTLNRQMKIIHLGGFTKAERKQFMPAIIHNIVNATYKILTKIYGDGIKLSGDNKDNYLTDDDQKKNIIFTLENGLKGSYFEVPNVLKALISVILQQKEFWNYFENYFTKFHLSDGVKFLLENFNDISSKDHLPTDQEILHSKTLTAGLFEMRFRVNNQPFIMYDVGGQRIERKKWCSVYEDISCALFIVGISEYNQELAEDTTKNRLLESIEVFQELISNPRLKDKSIVLFLNKVDIFERKIKTIPLSICFPECPKEIVHDAEKAKLYIKDKLWGDKRNEAKDSKLYLSRFTCATDTENITTVFEAVKNFCIQRDLEESGLLAKQ